MTVRATACLVCKTRPPAKSARKSSVCVRALQSSNGSWATVRTPPLRVVAKMGGPGTTESFRGRIILMALTTPGTYCSTKATSWRH
eukprot:2321337-Heterocapsa_arctica.AAC.1